jgi:hypothetical protein
MTSLHLLNMNAMSFIFRHTDTSPAVISTKTFHRNASCLLELKTPTNNFIKMKQ